MTGIRSMLAALALAPALAAAQAPAEAPKAAEPPKTSEGKAATAQGQRDAAKPAEGKAAGPRKEAQGKAAAAEAAPPSAARDLARALTTQETWDGILDGYAASLAGQISGALAATGKEAPPDLREKVRGDLHDAVRYEQAVDMQARALSGRFSADELRAIEAFYRSGPGKKLLDELPEIARQVNDELRARLSERVPKIVQRYAPSVASGGEGAPAPKAQGRTPPAGGASPPKRSARGTHFTRSRPRPRPRPRALSDTAPSPR